MKININVEMLSWMMTIKHICLVLCVCVCMCVDWTAILYRPVLSNRNATRVTWVVWNVLVAMLKN